MRFLSWALLLAALGSSAFAYEARVAPHNGRQTLFIDGQPVAPVIYHLLGSSATKPWEPLPQACLRDFAGAGYRLFGFQINLSQVWSEDGTDVEAVRRQIRAILDVRPDAAILIRIHTDAPQWWLDRHPEDWVGFALQPGNETPEALRARPAEGKVASFASRAWKQDAGEQLAALLRGLAASPEGDALFAIHVAGGQWHEWFYPSFEFEPDTGPAMTRHFREWLRERYKTDDALRAAWRKPEVTLDTAAVPGVDERFQTAERMFRDPQKERNVVDYYRCHQELVADTPLHFCRIVKQTWPRPIVVGLFHAYFLHLTHQAPGGHLEMRRVLESPDVDYLSSPFSYEFDSRFMGGSGHFRCLTETIRTHGKLWLSEMDHPTFVGDNFRRPAPFSPANVEDSVVTVRRNAAPMFALGQGMWWYDFGPADDATDGGWWRHPDLVAEAGRLRELAERLMARPYASPADVLLVYDTECFYFLAPMYLGFYNQSRHWYRTETLSFEAINRTVADAYRSGVAFDTVHLDDLARIDLGRYKAVVFGFTPYLSDEHVTFIRERVVAPGRAVVWVYAPGYTDGNTLDTGRVSDVVGMNIARREEALPPQLLLREGSLAPGFPETRVDTQIQDAWTGPVFRVEDESVEAFGYYGGSRDVALARKTLDSGAVTWYCALPLKNPAVMREIFRSAGAHIYSEKNDPLHIGGGILAIHTETGGPRRLSLPGGRVVEADLEPWSTTIYDLETGETLLK